MSLYGTAFRGILWPFYETLRGRKTPRLLREAEIMQWKTSDEIRDLQWTRLQELLHHAYQASPWHRDRFERLGISPGDIRTREDFKKLPALTRDDINAFRDRMLSRDYTKRVYLHRTGGSTGQPLQFYVNRESYEWRVAVTLRGYGWAGCHDGEKQFYVWGAPIGNVPFLKRAKASLHNLFLQRSVFSSFRFSEPAIRQCIREINLFRPQTIIGYTGALCLLAQYLMEHPQKVFYPSAVITGAEGVRDAQRQIIQKGFRAPVFASYGSREFMLIGMECSEHNGLHLNADNLFVEVVPPEDSADSGSSAGEILITDLHNFGMPFVRYKIGDLAVETNRVCRCGRGLPLLERVEGRILDLIRTPDGRIVPGEFFPHLMKEFDCVKQFQVVQKRMDALEIKLVLQGNGAGQGIKEIERHVKERLGDRTDVNIVVVPEIPLTGSGKFRVTVSELCERSSE